MIADLLGADKRILGDVFTRLEQGCGNPGLDIRLTGEVYGRLHMKMRELGLDPKDTTPHELYQSLLSLTARHDNFLAKRLGIAHPDDPQEVASAVVRLLERINLPKHSWAIKPVVAKRLLKATPPKVLMKQLNYRSVDSMLKREPATLLLTAARHSEPAQWQTRFVQSYKKLQANDFEVRDIEILYAQDDHWQAVGHFFSSMHRSNIIEAPEVGTIVLLPIEHRRPAGLTLVSLLLTLHHINDIRAFSTYCKFHHMRANFGALLVEHILHEKTGHVTIAGQSLHWQIVHRRYGMIDRLDHPEIFEPHVQPEDLAYHKAEAILFRIEPALHFWHDTDYLGLNNAEGPISFSLTDMALNLVNNLPYSKKANYHMRASLWNEIHSRYAREQTYENQILQQLDNQVLTSAKSTPDMEFAW